MFRNMKIGPRLTLSFLVMVAIVIGISAFSIVEMGDLSQLTANLFFHPYEVSTAALRVRNGITAMHRSMKDVALSNSDEEIEAAAQDVAGYETAILADFDLMIERFLGDDTQIENARQAFIEWRPIRNEVITLMIDDERAAAAAITRGRGADHIASLFAEIDAIIDFAENKAGEFAANAETTRNSTIRLTLIIVVAAVLVSLTLAILLTRSITKPLATLTDIAGEVKRGSFAVDTDAKPTKDELGILTGAFYSVIDFLREKSRVVAAVADGDLAVEASLASDKDTLGNGLRTMLKNLNELLAQVRMSAEQVTAASVQVTSASTELANGATAQASSVEEINASVNEVNGQSRQNADNSIEASNIARQAAANARAGNEQMQGVRTAMTSISHSSDEIKKVVKVIDDIAFQINLLALNANVEAARAGKYGKGFAVVAEEVRNLAARSGKAVQETTAMVDESVMNIETGNNLTNDTAKQLEEIVAGSDKVAEFLEEIAAASREQAQAIDQVTEGLSQVDEITQANTATAEETSGAAQQLVNQGSSLNASIAKFRLAHDTETTVSTKTLQFATSYGQEKDETAAGNESRSPGAQGIPEPIAAGARTNGTKPVIELDDDRFDRF